MNYKAFTLKCLTNMHVGGGDSDFGVVDNLVQRDPVTKYPTIYSSSLKGALREFCNGSSFVETVFGGEDNAGSYRFFTANLLAIPVRSNEKPFFMATTPSILMHFLKTLESFQIPQNGLSKLKPLSKISTIQNKALIHGGGSMKIEDWVAQQSNDILEDHPPIGKDVAILHETNFKELTNQLPVVARNNLENGQSTNLWYEEIIPRETLFYFVIGYGDDQEVQKSFEAKIQDGLVQIGGNASIGYGFTKITMIGG